MIMLKSFLQIPNFQRKFFGICCLMSLSLSSCEKCTTCKVSNDGNGNELTYPEYCSRNKEDIESFKKEVEAEANKNFTLYSCNDK
jgi:hypothetical protein